MSYTNYWHWTNPIADADKFAMWSRDVQHLLDYFTTSERELSSGMNFFGQKIQEREYPAICGPSGKGSPIMTPEIVAFNGNASQGLDYEGFVIRFIHLQEPLPDAGCKTNLEPYDKLVLCALVRLTHYFPDVILWSDGEEAAIRRGLHVCRDVFGENKQPRLVSEEMC